MSKVMCCVAQLSPIRIGYGPRVLRIRWISQGLLTACLRIARKIGGEAWKVVPCWVAVPFHDFSEGTEFANAMRDRVHAGRAVAILPPLRAQYLLWRQVTRGSARTRSRS